MVSMMRDLRAMAVGKLLGTIRRWLLIAFCDARFRIPAISHSRLLGKPWLSRLSARGLIPTR